jgi:hypothetical protein
MPAFPVSSLDPFADDFLTAPYPFYAELREAGRWCGSSVIGCGRAHAMPKCWGRSATGRRSAPRPASASMISAAPSHGDR